MTEIVLCRIGRRECTKLGKKYVDRFFALRPELLPEMKATAKLVK